MEMSLQPSEEIVGMTRATSGIFRTARRATEKKNSIRVVFRTPAHLGASEWAFWLRAYNRRGRRTGTLPQRGHSISARLADRDDYISATLFSLYNMAVYRLKSPNLERCQDSDSGSSSRRRSLHGL